jgi:peptide/nickel transport system substrate-binding protein
MKSKLLWIGLFFVTFACSDDSSEKLVASGGAVYGGELKLMSSEKITNLFPLSSEDVYEQRVNNQIFESLLKIDQTGTHVIPSLAESFTISADAKTYTFKLRKGVYFHADDCFSDKTGREVVARDIQYCMQFACSGLPENKIGNLLINKIKGAKKFHDATIQSMKGQSVAGIKVVNDYTIEINLDESYVGFDKILTHSNLGIFAPEAYEKYGKEILKHPVGTGPFQIDSWDNRGLSLKRNPKYWKKDSYGNQLPYLDKVVLTYSKSKKDELLAFRKEKIDIILEIPADEIENTLGTLKEAQAGKNIKHKVDSKGSVSVNFFGFATGVKPFNDVNVRKAFNVALDRNELVTNWMKGEGYPMLNGFVPPGSSYPTNKVEGFKFDIAQAKQWLASAGYPGGNGFPVLDLYINTQKGSSTYELSKGIQKQLKENLNIDINIKLCSLKEREKAVKNGNALIWKTGWVADYPDASNFLDLFYSGENSVYKSNPYQYNNPRYNALLEASMKEKDNDKRLDLLVQCDQIIIDEAVVMPVFNDDFITMVNAKVRNFETNSMEILDFSTIFIKEPNK